MKIAAVACFANELAIAGAFRDQLETFFDNSFLVAHRSSDKTAELFQGSDKFSVTKVEDVLFRQSDFSRDQMVKAFAAGADWVIFLDFDEFLPFESRIDLENFLSKHGDKDVISWAWQCIYPETLGHPDIFKRKFVTIPDAPSYRKIIISKSAYEKDPSIGLTHGAHEHISYVKLDKHLENDLKLIHIPIHGLDHYKQKSINRVLFEADSDFFRESVDMYFSAGFIDEEMLKEEALNYGVEPKVKAGQIDFAFIFPYVKSQYLNEKASTIDSLFAAIYQIILKREDTKDILKEREAYLDHLTVKAMMQSRSWKITKPMRDLNGLIKKIRSLKR